MNLENVTSSVADHIARKSGDCNMFMGEYNHTIDAKGRLIIPAKFRDALGESFVVTKGFDGCLFVYDKTEWASFEQKLKALPLGNKEARNLVRFFLAGADEVELDKQGRILVAPPLREYATLEKDVTVIGVGNRVEIWNKDKYLDEATFDNMDEIAEQLQSIGFGI